MTSVAAPSPPVVISEAKPQGRLIELDVLRGFLLLWMTFTHLPTAASMITNQTFGFVSGAEGFIFLSAFILAQLEHRRFMRDGEVGVMRDVAKRTLRVYTYHSVLLLSSFIVFAPLANTIQSPAVQNLFSFYLQDPKHAVVAALLLLYRPSLFDILPMYIVFLPLTALTRSVAARWGWRPVMGISIAFWVAGQFGLRHFLYVHTQAFGLGVPENSTGAFDLFAWQLLWIGGLALGTHYAKRKEGFRPPRWAVVAALSAAAIFLVLRYSPVDHWMNPDLYGHLIDKWHLGPARVVNFAALTVIVVRYGCTLGSLPGVRSLVILGQASIEVFCVHIVCCLLGDLWSRSPDPSLPAWQQATVLLFTLAALFGTGLIRRKLVEHTRTLNLKLEARA